MNEEDLIRAGFTPEEARAYLAKNPPAATPQAQPSDASAVAQALAVPAAYGVGGAAAILGGVKGVQAAKAGIANHESRSYLRRAVNESEGGVQGLIQKIQEFNQTGRGSPMSLAEVDPRMAAEADFAATNNPATRVALSAHNTARRRAMPQRLLADVQRIAPGGYADAEGILQQLQQDRSAWADSDAGYEGLRQRNPVIPEEGVAQMRAFIADPKLASAWHDAASVGAVGPLPAADPRSFEVLQRLKERLFALKERAWAAHDGDLGRRLGAAYNHLDGLLDDHVPGYREVNAEYAQRIAREEAVQFGRDAYHNQKLQLPEFERQLAAVAPENRALVQQGMLGAYLADTENARRNSGFFETMMTDLPVQQRKLEIAFGGKDAAKQALQAFQQEIGTGMLGRIVGGSESAPRIGRQAAAGTVETALDAAHAITSPVTAIPSIARRGIVNWMPGAVAERMGPAFRPQNAPELEAFLRTLMRLPK